MNLTEENYFSLEADKKFMSVSQFKKWQECEAQAYAIYVEGTYRPSGKEVFLQGNLVHSYLQSRAAYNTFLEQNEHLITTKKGDLKAPYQRALQAAQKALKNDYFNTFLKGEKEQILIAELFGVEWKIKSDILNHEKKWLVDIKYIKSLDVKDWVRVYLDMYGNPSFKQDDVFTDPVNLKVPFYDKYNYWLQLAIYQQVVYKNTGDMYKPIIAALTKEEPSVLQVIDMDNEHILQKSLFNLENALDRIQSIKYNTIKAKSCGKCAFCKEKLNNEGKCEIVKADSILFN